MGIPFDYNPIGVIFNNAPEPIDETDYLRFTANVANSAVKLTKTGSPSAIVLEYSTDKKNWSNYEVDDIITLQNIGDKVYFRGDNETLGCGPYTGNNYNFAFSGNVNADGNIMSLLDKSCELLTISSSFCFANLFAGAYYTLSSAPKLPATKLSEYCYSEMFKNSYIQTPPELPALTAEFHCYDGMFNHCLLSSAPELPATTLNYYCYARMFENNNFLKDTPHLPASSLAYGCYQRMFKDCTYLTGVTDLPATELANYCYNEMFYNCEFLRKTPDVLPATTLKPNCYDTMFMLCKYLTKGPKLPATLLSSASYAHMFQNCVRITEIDVNFDEWSNATFAWVNGIAPTGIFKCPSTLSTAYGNHYIPNGWTVAYNDYFYIEATSNETYGFLKYYGHLEGDGPYEIVDEEAWEEEQEPIYHEAITHWDDELQEEVVDEDEWYEDQPPIIHDAVTHNEFYPIPPYVIEYSTDMITWQSADFTALTWDPQYGQGPYSEYDHAGYYYIPDIGAGKKIYLRGSNTTFNDTSDPNNFAYGVFEFSNSVISGGNIMSLLDPTMQQSTAPSGCFDTLFSQMTFE